MTNYCHVGRQQLSNGCDFSKGRIESERISIIPHYCSNLFLTIKSGGGGGVVQGGVTPGCPPLPHSWHNMHTRRSTWATHCQPLHDNVEELLLHEALWNEGILCALLSVTEGPVWGVVGPSCERVVHCLCQNQHRIHRKVGQRVAGHNGVHPLQHLDRGKLCLINHVWVQQYIMKILYLEK